MAETKAKTAKKPKELAVRKATLRQKKALELMVVNGSSQADAMRGAGYSEAIATVPSKVTQSKSFIALLEEMGLTDDKLVQVMKEGLYATKATVMGAENDTFVDIQPDYAIRHKYLETSLKVKGHSRTDQFPTNVNFVNIVADQKDKYS